MTFIATRKSFMSFYPKEQNVLVLDPGSFSTFVGGIDSPPRIFRTQESDEFLVKLFVQLGCLLTTNQHPLVLTVPAYQSAAETEQLVRLLFERVNVPGLVVVEQSLCCLFATGYATGLVVDVGHSHLSVTPIFDNVPAAYATVVVELGGADVTRYLSERIPAGLDATHVKEQLAKVAQSAKRADEQPAAPYVQDGHTHTITHHAKCCEVLFDPRLAGKTCLSLPEAMFQAVSKCEFDKQAVLWENVILTGGCALLDGWFINKGSSSGWSTSWDTICASRTCSTRRRPRKSSSSACRDIWPCGRSGRTKWLFSADRLLRGCIQ
jgi:actin-related protein